MRAMIRILIFLLLCLLLYWFMARMHWLPSLKSWFGASPVLIEETPLLIAEIKEIAQLMTIEASDEVAVSSYRRAEAGSAKKLLEWISPIPTVQLDRMVLVVQGKVYAGTDLSRLDSAAVYTSGDSISVRIPRATILDVVVNPSGTDVFIEEGKWTQAELSQLAVKAKEKLKSRALEKGLINKADQQALLVMHQFLELLGFKRIRVVTSS